MVVPMHPTGYGPAVQHTFRRTQLPPFTEENVGGLGAAVQHNFMRTNYRHLGRRISVAWALRYSITSDARCWCHLGRKSSLGSGHCGTA